MTACSKLHSIGARTHRFGRGISLGTLTLICLVVIGIVANEAHSSPSLMSYQGRLVKADGTPVADGNYTITVRIWSDLTSTDPEYLRWSETLNVASKGGVFAAILGQQNPLNLSVFSGSIVYLELQIGGDDPMTPRQPVTTVPYTFHADLATTVPDASIVTVKLADKAVTPEKIDPTGASANGQALVRQSGDTVAWGYPIAGSLQLPIEVYTEGIGLGLGIYNRDYIAITGLHGIQGWDQPNAFEGSLGFTYGNRSAAVYGGSGFRFHDYWSGTYGALATSDRYGVLGYSETSSAAAVKAFGNGSMGVFGEAENQVAGYFANGGDTSQYPTLVAIAPGPGYGLYVRNFGLEGGNWTIYADAWGDGKGVYVTTPPGKEGLVVAGGTKSAVVRTDDGARLMYCEESTAVWFSDYGTATTRQGSATVTLDPVFRDAANLNTEYHVFLEEYGDAETYVSRKTPEYFEIRVRSGDPEVEVSYRVVAKRKGYENTRLERAPWADDDANLDPGKPRKTFHFEKTLRMTGSR